MKKKTNSYLADTIILAKKGNAELAACLAMPSRQRPEVNVSKLSEAKSSEVIVPGKVLGSGDVTGNKKITVYAMAFSESAREKLKKAGCSCISLGDALKKNPKLKAEIIR